MSFHEGLERRIQRHLQRFEKENLVRRLTVPKGIDLSSNDYLCLSNHPLLKREMADAVMNEGCGSTASRLLRGHRRCFADVERRFAEFKQTGSALYFGAGYLANLSVLSTFIERHDAVFSDEQNHASLIDGIRLSRAKRIKFPHCDVASVARLVRETPAGVQKFLITESLFSMDGDFAPLAEYAELCKETGTTLIIDEAHAVGIYGDRGSGVVEKTGIEEAVFATINTAGKALGVACAFVAAPEWAIDYLIQAARPLIFSTAPPPSVARALEAALTLIHQEPARRQQLMNKAAFLRAL